ncbi:hypothetical protein CVT24_008312 [Panaeolus cyanescens]|uniref:Uncharacterized protein n=1 Tax=Panaeolus cyanescens TaxID=181874 RepID=A0A409YLR4_9AGAR|nr:hypothetical protein CVT24_008312 [Panaeolus cyanescens]
MSTLPISINSISSLTTAVINYDPQLLSTAVTELMKILSPLISSGNGLDEEISKSLKGVKDQFVQAVHHMCITIKHTVLGLSLLCSLLTVSPSKLKPLSISKQLHHIAEDFLAGNACATDSLEQYRALRMDVENQFDLLAQKFGEESVINVSGNSSTTTSTLKTLRTTITRRLHESENVSSATVDILTGINNLLRKFLEDESFSLSNPLATAPLFSPDMLRTTWTELRGRFLFFEVELRRPMLTFEMGYILGAADSSRELEEDKLARKTQFPEVLIKLQGIPEDSGTSPTSNLPPREKLISVGIPKTSGVCTIYVEHCENEQPGTTGVRAIFSIPVPDTRSRLKSVCVRASVTHASSDSPTCALKNRSTTVEQIILDPNFEPPNCKPVFTSSQPTQSTLEWMFLKPFLRLGWKSAPILPTQLALSFDLVHSTHVKLQLSVVFRFRRRLFGGISDVVNAQVQVEPRSTTAEMSLAAARTTVIDEAKRTDKQHDGQPSALPVSVPVTQPSEVP